MNIRSINTLKMRQILELRREGYLERVASKSAESLSADTADCRGVGRKSEDTMTAEVEEVEAEEER